MMFKCKSSLKINIVIRITTPDLKSYSQNIITTLNILDYFCSVNYLSENIQGLKLEFNFHQSGVIPYRRKNGELQVLLITSIKRKKWIFPKGYIEFNLSPFESAKKEAYEEAGVIGANETFELGTFSVKRSIGVCDLKIFSMEVIEVLDDYPERDVRKRKWFPVKEAAETVSISEVSGMILSLGEKIKK